MKISRPRATKLSQLTIDQDLVMGAHNITLGAGQTVDGRDVSGLGDMATSVYDPTITYYLLDDFDDNLLNGRSSVISLKHLLKAHLTVTNFRPEWEQVAGTTTFLSGIMAFDEGGERVKTPSTFVEGTWELTLNFNVLNNSDGLQFYFMYIDATHYYYIRIQKDSGGLNKFLLIANAGGGDSIIIPGTWSLDTDNHIFKITRNASGDFEIFEDNVSKGTATNTGNTTSAEIHLLDVSDSNARIRELKAY